MSGGGLTKEALEKLSELKLNDAKLLFHHGSWSNAYYLAGYAVELGLKACSAKQIFAATIPDKKFANTIYTHSFETLISLAGLRAELRLHQDVDSNFAQNWGIASEWSPDARYDVTDKSSAHYLLNAISEQAHGVLPWIKTYW